MSIPSLSYLEATIASVDSALRAYNNRRRELILNLTRSGDETHLSP